MNGYPSSSMSHKGSPLAYAASNLHRWWCAVTTDMLEMGAHGSSRALSVQILHAASLNGVVLVHAASEVNFQPISSSRSYVVLPIRTTSFSRDPYQRSVRK